MASEAVSRAPTLIAYRWRQLRYSKLGLPLAFVLGGLFLASLFHVTRLRCSRGDDRCSVDAHGLWVETEHVNVRASDVTEMRVEVTKGSKTSYARATLETKHGAIDVAGRPFLVRFDPDSARRAQRAVERFLKGEAASVDVSIDPGSLCIWVGILSLMNFAAAAIIAKHDALEVFDVCIIVDHDKRLVHMGARDVPLADIKDIRLEIEELPEWSYNGRKKRFARIAVETTRGEVLHATKKVGAGGMAEHRRALQELRAAANFPAS